MKFAVEINGRARRVEVEGEIGSCVVTVDGHRQVVDVTVIEGIWSLILEEPGGTRRSHEVTVVEDAATSGKLTVHINGRVFAASVAADVPSGVASGFGRKDRTATAASAGNGPHRITAPMPGKVARVLAKPGEQVAARQGLIVVEAMKMENELRSPRAGTVAEVLVTEGASVEAGTVLVVIE